MAFIADTQSALSDYREGVEASDAKFNKEKAYYEQRLKNYNINREAFAALMEKPTANHNAGDGYRKSHEGAQRLPCGP